MRNCWIDRRRDRQLTEVAEFLMKNFGDLHIMKRPHLMGQKLFIRQLGLHLGNILYEGAAWRIQFYHQDGSYVDRPLPEQSSAEFWEEIKAALQTSAVRAAIKKSA